MISTMQISTHDSQDEPRAFKEESSVKNTLRCHVTLFLGYRSIALLFFGSQS